jgi:hypothetical protein
VPVALGGLCGACLMDAALEPPRVVGDYECHQAIGEGAMGTVFLARHVSSDELVALKLAKRELMEAPGGPALFRQQARTESALQHPNIVHVQGAGTHQGVPFIVMPLMTGGTLAEPGNSARHAAPAARLRLVLTIARAVQFAHERGVLHCDLKHENILFDEDGEPHVSDFGLARAINTAGVRVAGATHGGTRGWMSPEQVRCEELTTASDVFALGVLLHWLSTGTLPFGEGADFEARVLAELAPALPRWWAPGLDWGLRAIAHKALQKQPEQRYASAAGFANDLKRLQEQQAIRGASVPVWGWAWYWALRHVAARYAILLLLPCFALAAQLVARAQKVDLRRAALDMNAYAASGQAAAVLYQLRDYAEVIERAAADPAVRALVHGPRRVARAAGPSWNINACRVQSALEDPTPLARYSQSFSTMVVLDADGCARARVSAEPAPPGYIRNRFEWRDYFAAAHADAAQRTRTTHVRKAYRSSVSRLIKFAVSTPLFEDQTWIGVVSGSITTASTLELPRMRRGETNDRMTVLLGPFEGESASDYKPMFTFLVHPKLELGAKVELEGGLAAELARAFHRASASVPQFQLGTTLPLQRSGYVDPLLGDRWLAAFAPVGGTGYVVLVQTRDSVATRPSDGLIRLAVGLGTVWLALLAAWGSFWFWRGRCEHRARAQLHAQA